MSQPGSTPSPSWSFSERLDWLLETIPRVPGGGRRFSAEDLVGVLARVEPVRRRTIAEALEDARAWMDSARGTGSIPNHRASGRYVAAMEHLFRLPLGYFRDAQLAARTDTRIQFASAAAMSGLRVLGPCRVMASEITAEQLHTLYREVDAALDRRRPVS